MSILHQQAELCRQDVHIGFSLRETPPTGTLQHGSGPGSSEVPQLVTQGREDAVAPPHRFCRPLALQVDQLSPSRLSLPFPPFFPQPY